jgi:hypothetical protein
MQNLVRTHRGKRPVERSRLGWGEGGTFKTDYNEIVGRRV